MEALVIVAAIVVVIVIFVAVWVYNNSRRIVPEDERLVIHRAGQFNRIAGPGPVHLLFGDRVKKVVSVRNHPVEIPAPGIFAFGVPNDFTVNLWYRVDIEAAARGDKTQQMRLAQITEAERERQVQVLVREALINRVAELQEQMPLSYGATLLDGVAAMAPGTERYKALVKGITAELEQTLPSVGVILDATHPVSLVGRGIPDDIIEAVKRKRSRTIDSDWLKEYVDDLHERFPDISKTVLAQMLASIEGIDLSNVQGLLLEQETGGQARVGVKLTGDGKTISSVTVKPDPPPSEPDQTVEPQSQHLTEQDLAVLKRVPRHNRTRRVSA